MKFSDFTPFARQERIRILIAVTVLLLLYVPSRIILLTIFTPIGSDVDLYARYAYACKLAQEKKTGFYDLYREMGLRDSIFSSYSLRDLIEIPYPPLAIRFLTIPTPFILRGKTADTIPLDDFIPRYHTVYRRVCAVVEIVLILFGMCMVMVLFPGERPVDTVMRCGILCGAGVLLPHVIFDRLDMVLALLLLVSLSALISRYWLVSFFLFACAVNFKPIPVFLVPLWMYGTMTARDVVRTSATGRAWRMATIFCFRGGVLVLMIGALAAFFILFDGTEAFGYLFFHAERGIHIESTWGAAGMLVARLFHIPFQIVYDFGAFNVAMAGTSTLSRASSFLLILVITIYGVIIGRQMLQSGPKITGENSLLVNPLKLIAWTSIFLGTIFCVFKMFSPQFLLLLVPLAALIPFKGLGYSAFAAVFAGCCCMSTFIYPYFYTTDIVYGPTGFGLFLLISRSVMLCGLTIALFCWIISANDGKLKNANGLAGR